MFTCWVAYSSIIPCGSHMNSSIHTTSYCTTWTDYTIASIDLGLVPFLSLDSVWWPFLFILRKVLLQSVCWTIVGECVIRWTRNDGHEDLFVLRYDELVQISCRVTMEIEQRPDSLLSFRSFDLVLLLLWNEFQKKKKRVKTIRKCYKVSFYYSTLVALSPLWEHLLRSTVTDTFILLYSMSVGVCWLGSSNINDECV